MMPSPNHPGRLPTAVSHRGQEKEESSTMMKWLKVPEDQAVRVNHKKLSTLMTRIFTRYGLREEDAAVCADVLVMADLRGVDSHAVSNAVQQIYVPALKDGRINPRPNVTTVSETATTAVVDGDQAWG